MIDQIIAYGIMLGVFYGLVAVGLALLFGVMKYLNIAHGSFLVLGGYFAYWLFTLWGVDPFLSLPLVMGAMFVIGIVVYYFLFSPLGKFPEGQRLGNSMLITFGLIMILDNLLAFLWTTDPKTIAVSYSGQSLEFLGVRFPLVRLAVLSVTAVIILALHLFLTRTYFGKSLRATAEDWEAASLLGININRTYLIACGLSIALAGAAGISVAMMYSITPYSGLEWLLTALVVLVLAGLGNIREVFAAGVILGLVEQLSIFFIGGQYRTVVGLVVFVIILLLRPQGLFKR